MKPRRPPTPQTELFPETAPARTPVPGRNATAAEPPPDASGDRTEAFEMLLALSTPVRAGSHAAAWLKARRVYKKTWDAQNLRVVDNYRHAAEGLRMRFPLKNLTAWGLFNKEGHLRFYRHSLLFPWMDEGRAQYLQARAPDPEVKPPELFSAGPAPCPYNARLLDGGPGRLYLCAGVIDTMVLLEAGFPAVGVPGEGNLKPAWLPRFRGKSVYVAFDADARGEAAAAKAVTLLAGAGVEAHRLHVPAGKDVGEWVAGK